MKHQKQIVEFILGVIKMNFADFPVVEKTKIIAWGETLGHLK